MPVRFFYSHGGFGHKNRRQLIGEYHIEITRQVANHFVGLSHVAEVILRKTYDSGLPGNFLYTNNVDAVSNLLAILAVHVFLGHNTLWIVRNANKCSHLVAALYKLLAYLGYLKMLWPVMLADH